MSASSPFIAPVALHTPSHSGVGDLLSYASDRPLPPGTLVRVPLGNREMLGVVWDSDAATGELPDGATLALPGIGFVFRAATRSGASGRKSSVVTLDAVTELDFAEDDDVDQVSGFQGFTRTLRGNTATENQAAAAKRTGAELKVTQRGTHTTQTQLAFDVKSSCTPPVHSPWHLVLPHHRQTPQPS